MDLILWRHAQAEDGSPDEARPLTGRGVKDAAAVAAWLRARLPAGGVSVLCSPTVRTRRTAEALALPFEVSERVGPGASFDAVLDACGWSGGHDSGGGGAVIVVGHQPWIGQAAAAVLTGRGEPWPVRKGAFWWFARRAHGEVLVRAALSPDMLR
jgi:phosphohistidine phosphatase